MPSTMIYDAGDIVLVGFPFTSLNAVKKRPAVVISNYDYQTNRPDIVLMAITSQIRQPLGFAEYPIHDWAAAGLLKPSVLKPLIATLEQPRIIKRMGRLTKRDIKSLGNALNTMLSSN